MSTLLPPLALANSARAQAIRNRARALHEVAEDRTTAVQIVRESSTAHGRPLLRITLRQLLLAQPGWGEARTTQTIDHMLRTLGGISVPPRRLHLAWLLDPRANGRRFMAFCDALAKVDTPPWAGFPFTPKPARPAVTSGGTK